MIGRSGVASKSDGIVQLGLRVNDVPPTSGFASYAELADHFHKHITQRREFACADEKEYEAAAIAFITPDEDPPNTEDCVRARDNTLIRFDRRRNMICYLLMLMELLEVIIWYGIQTLTPISEESVEVNNYAYLSSMWV